MVNALLLQAPTQPSAPGVLADAAEERRLGAGAGGGHRHVGQRAAAVGHEGRGLLRRVHGFLADEVDDRLAEAEDRHRVWAMRPRSRS